MYLTVEYQPYQNIAGLKALIKECDNYKHPRFTLVKQEVANNTKRVIYSWPNTWAKHVYAFSQLLSDKYSHHFKSVEVTENISPYYLQKVA